MPSYTAYVPVYNQAASLGAVLAALRAQTAPPAEILVVDDGSTDGSAKIAETAGANVLRQARQLGRGAARARALAEARYDFVLCCDSSNCLAPDFAARGLAHLAENPRLASVLGRLTQRAGGGVAHRWRGRHLFLGRPGPLEKNAPHATWAAVTRRAAVLAVGNYRADWPAHEDSELGGRLQAAGWEMWCDPAMVAECVVENTLGQVLARYARWHEPRGRGWSWRDYPHNLRMALTVHARGDLAESDWPAALISLWLPHYLLARAGGRPAAPATAAQP
jgi:glycosyltransferase involved in cell wall biosynthesis